MKGDSDQRTILKLFLLCPGTSPNALTTDPSAVPGLALLPLSSQVRPCRRAADLVIFGPAFIDVSGAGRALKLGPFPCFDAGRGVVVNPCCLAML